VPAPKVAVPRKLLKRFGVPLGETLHHFVMRRGTLYACCEVFEGGTPMEPLEVEADEEG